MSAVDLNVFEFDYDLTLSILLMHPDGTVYHRYGARDERDAMSWMGMESLVALLRDTLQDHRAYTAEPQPPAVLEPQLVVDMPPMKRRLEKGVVDCVHCHTVHDSMQQWAVERGDWQPGDRWIYPSPEQVGLELEAFDQALVEAVAPESPAAAAGLAAGDRLSSLGEQHVVRTVGDVQWALHKASGGETAIPLTFVRDGEQRSVELAMADGWKECSPADYAWRPFKWNLSPAPGFGGPALSEDDKRQLGIDPAHFAFRVQYLVDWGPRRHRGEQAHDAGIRRGDVITAFAGKRDFESIDHFHAWVRLTRAVGEVVEVELLRGGEKTVVEFEVPR